MEENRETDREDDYIVKDVVEDDDYNIYVGSSGVDKEKLTILGQTRFWDAFISPDTGKAVGQVYTNTSFDRRFSYLGLIADDMGQTQIAINSLPGEVMDVKTTTQGYSSYSGVLLDGKYMTLREIGNALAGYNAAGSGQSFAVTQRVAGGLHVAGPFGAALAKMGMTFGEAPNYGEVDYQRTRSEYGYNLNRDLV